MIKRSDDLIFDFAKTIVDQHPGLSQDDIYAICRSPFKAVTDQMKTGQLKDIRVKYLGTFVVFPGRVKGILNSLQKKVGSGKVSSQLVQRAQVIHDNYFKQRDKDGDNTCKKVIEG